MNIEPNPSTVDRILLFVISKDEIYREPKPSTVDRILLLGISKEEI